MKNVVIIFVDVKCTIVGGFGLNNKEIILGKFPNIFGKKQSFGKVLGKFWENFGKHF